MVQDSRALFLELAFRSFWHRTRCQSHQNFDWLWVEVGLRTKRTEQGLRVGLVLPRFSFQLQRSEKDRWSFISECSGQGGKNCYGGWSIVFIVLYLIIVSMGYQAKKTTWALACTCLTWGWLMELWSTTCAIQARVPACSLHVQGVPPPSDIDGVAARQSQALHSLLWDGVSSSGWAAATIIDSQSFLHKGDGLPLLISPQSSRKLPKVYLASSVWRGLWDATAAGLTGIINHLLIKRFLTRWL